MARAVARGKIAEALPSSPSRRLPSRSPVSSDPTLPVPLRGIRKVRNKYSTSKTSTICTSAGQPGWSAIEPTIRLGCVGVRILVTVYAIWSSCGGRRYRSRRSAATSRSRREGGHQRVHDLVHIGLCAALSAGARRSCQERVLQAGASSMRRRHPAVPTARSGRASARPQVPAASRPLVRAGAPAGEYGPVVREQPVLGRRPRRRSGSSRSRSDRPAAPRRARRAGRPPALPCSA